MAQLQKAMGAKILTINCSNARHRPRQLLSWHWASGHRRCSRIRILFCFSGTCVSVCEKGRKLVFCYIRKLPWHQIGVCSSIVRFSIDSQEVYSFFICCPYQTLSVFVNALWMEGRMATIFLNGWMAKNKLSKSTEAQPDTSTLYALYQSPPKCMSKPAHRRMCSLGPEPVISI